MKVADSDVLIDFLRGAPHAEQIAREIRSGALYTTVISAFELWSGARSAPQLAVVDTLLAALTLLPVDPGSARRAAELRRDLEARKASIGMGDSLIAGICLQRGGTLITRNRKHFERVPGLKLAGSGS